MRTVRLCVAVTLLAACGSPGATSPPVSTVLSSNAIVRRVVDGDTIVVRLAGRDETIRLIGIDTPETLDPDEPVECFGPEASAFTASLLPEGTPVRLERDVEARDDYDRLLAYVHRATDGLFVNVEIVRSGHASVLTFPLNVTHTEAFVAAAREAREARRGLWSVCVGSVPP